MIRRVFLVLAILTLTGPASAGWSTWRSFRRLPPVAGCVLQFESDTGITLSGSAVSSWKDQKSGFVVSQGTAGKQPGFTAADSAFSGRPTLTGTVAAATQLTNTTDTPFASGATRTMFFVFTATNGAGSNGTLMDSRHAATGRVEWLWGDLSGATWLYTDSVAINQTIPTVGSDLTDRHYMSEIWTFGAVIQTWLNGTAKTVSGGVPAIDVAAAGFDIFSRQNGASPHEGKITAELGFTGALSTGDRQLVELYLAQKYGF